MVPGCSFRYMIILEPAYKASEKPIKIFISGKAGKNHENRMRKRNKKQ